MFIIKVFAMSEVFDCDTSEEIKIDESVYRVLERFPLDQERKKFWEQNQKEHVIFLARNFQKLQNTKLSSFSRKSEGPKNFLLQCLFFRGEKGVRNGILSDKCYQ